MPWRTSWRTFLLLFDGKKQKWANDVNKNWEIKRPSERWPSNEWLFFSPLFFRSNSKERSGAKQTKHCPSVRSFRHITQSEPITWIISCCQRHTPTPTERPPSSNPTWPSFYNPLLLLFLHQLGLLKDDSTRRQPTLTTLSNFKEVVLEEEIFCFSSSAI